jgi:hypothetical protein
MRSTGDSHLANASGQKTEWCVSSQFWKFITYAPLPKAHNESTPKTLFTDAHTSGRTVQNPTPVRQTLAFSPRTIEVSQLGSQTLTIIQLP